MDLNRVVTTALNIYVVHTVEVGGRPGSGYDVQRFRKVAVVGSKVELENHPARNWAYARLEDVGGDRSDWGSDPKENFMRDFSASRKFFTEGQIFRMHLG